MQKIENKRYQETYYKEVLENGLSVVLWQKPSYQKSLFMMATPLGAMDLKQEDEDGTCYEFPAGIAHFLEHKMFAMGDSDVMDEFSTMGANVNAFTSYNETAYYTSTSGDPLPPLHLLLDFVQCLDVSEASVEKEKGIIVQELHMYKEMSDQRLLMESYASLYQEHPLKYDIGGDDESVISISLEQLKQCYELNYHPSQMILVGVSSQNPQTLMDEIKANQARKNFPKGKQIKREIVREPKQVKRDQFTFSMDVSEPKINISYKLGGIADPGERMRREWSYRLLLDANFTSLNPLYQQWMDDGIINDYCGCDADFGEDYGSIMFFGETRQIDAFLALCETCMDAMHSGVLHPDVLEQLKRRYFSQAVRSLNSFDDIAITYIRNYFEGSDFFSSMDVLEKLTMKDIEESAKYISKENRAIVRLEPFKEK